MSEKNNSKIDVPVLIIFFSRANKLSKVFEEVKKARPSKLYLYQDGARKNRPDDRKGIEECRKLVSDDKINWDCEVHRLYQSENKGCDPSEFIAQKWMFKTEEMGIILEDDDIPSQSFFPFCLELLNRYKDDTRIHMICGMNNYDINEKTSYSYFFSRRGSIWGWATWRRVIDTWDERYLFLNNPDQLRLLKENFPHIYETFIKTSKMHKASGRDHYESINGASQYINNRVNIVPKYNMITNIGIGDENTHSVNDIRKLPSKIQKLFYKKRYEIDFPLKHPNFVMIDQAFDQKFDENLFSKIMQKIEKRIRGIVYSRKNKNVLGGGQ